MTAEEYITSVGLLLDTSSLIDADPFKAQTLTFHKIAAVASFAAQTRHWLHSPRYYGRYLCILGYYAQDVVCPEDCLVNDPQVWLRKADERAGSIILSMREDVKRFKGKKA